MKLTDIHCHLLPNVDDGAESMTEAVLLLKMEYAQGVRRIVVTPHYRVGMFETPQEVIDIQYRRLREAAKKIGKDLKIYLGCEYHSNSDMLTNLKEKKRPTLAGGRYVLTEFSGLESFERIRRQVRMLALGGYIPVIAHVERCLCLVEDFGCIEELIAFGAKLQVNASSVLGKNGRKSKSFCKKMMKQDLLHFIASDAHHVKERAPDLGICARYVEKKMGHIYAQKIFVRNLDNMFAANKENKG